MANECARLLRRPLPPKYVPQPPSVVKSRPHMHAGTTVLLSLMEERKVKQSGTERSESCCEYNSRWDYDYPVAAPTSRLAKLSTPLLPEVIDCFPARALRPLPKMPLLKILQTDSRFVPAPPIFCFNDFLRDLNCSAVQSLEGLRKVALSRCNYKKLIGLFLMELHKGQQTEVSNNIISAETVPVVKNRIPHRQLLYELVALIRMEAQAQMICRRRSFDDIPVKSAPRSVEVWVPQCQQEGPDQDNQFPGNDVILNSVTTKHFQGSRRTNSPFQHSGEVISPSELAILDCLTEGGKALNLKAHFVAVLPDLSPLNHCLVYLNLSFNDLSIFPLELCELTQLEVLKMRDNPIEEIPPGINHLVKLRTLVISFCKITYLPLELYHLANLEALDVSYNLISSLSNDISKLRSLEYLNVEGNQLVAMPCGALRLPITQLKTSKNLMHPYFWGLSGSSPQTLFSMATRTLALTHASEDYASLPPEAQLALERVDVCDCCKGPLYGRELGIIRPCHNIFGLHMVPFIFYACTPTCRKNFQSQTESPSNLLYVEDTFK